MFNFIQVESYNVKYHNLGENVEDLEATIPLADLKEGKIILDNFPQEVDKGVKIEGRIKYLGFDTWSPWSFSPSEVNQNTKQLPNKNVENKTKTNKLELVEQ